MMRPAPLPARAAARLLLLLAALLPASCSRDAEPIDPAVVERPLPGPDTPVDSALARAGEQIYQLRCLACHKLGEGVAVGPDLAGVTEQRDPVWLRGMIMNPDSMLRVDPIARELLLRYRVPMANPRLSEAQFRAVLEFLRTQPATP